MKIIRLSTTILQTAVVLLAKQFILTPIVYERPELLGFLVVLALSLFQDGTEPQEGIKAIVLASCLSSFDSSASNIWVAEVFATIAAIFTLNSSSFKEKLAYFVVGTQVVLFLNLNPFRYVVQFLVCSVVLHGQQSLRLPSMDCFTGFVFLSTACIDLAQYLSLRRYELSAHSNSYSSRSCLSLVAVAVVWLLVLTCVFKALQLTSPRSWRVKQAYNIIVSAVMVATLWMSMYRVLQADPVLWITQFLIRDDFRRLYLCGYWIACLSIAIPFAQYAATKRWPKICNRKIFHLLAAAMFNLPLLDPRLLSFLCLAMGVAACVLLLLEILRCNAAGLGIEVPGLNDILLYFKLFVDNRDEARPVVLSHLYLLFACACPVWFWAYLVERSPELAARPLLALLPHMGYVTVGLGDAFAAIIGSQLGRRKWPHSSRTYEGSMAAVVVMFSAMAVIVRWQSVTLTPALCWHMFVISAVVAVVEATTSLNDNLVLPMVAIAVACILEYTNWGDLLFII